MKTERPHPMGGSRRNDGSRRARRGGTPLPGKPCEAGFSLVELIIAMVLSTLITGAVVASLVTHGRLVENLSASSEQTGQVRDALLMLNTELTDLTTGSVAAAEPDSVSFRLPVIWGLLCGQKDGKTKPKELAKEEDGYLWMDDDVFDPQEYDQDGDFRGFAVFENAEWKYFDVPSGAP